MTARMENYIKEVIRIIHEGWPGLLTAFDVVNEAVTDAARTEPPRANGTSLSGTTATS